MAEPRKPAPVTYQPEYACRATLHPVQTGHAVVVVLILD